MIKQVLEKVEMNGFKERVKVYLVHENRLLHAVKGEGREYISLSGEKIKEICQRLKEAWITIIQVFK